jgi:hypothetical protein
VAKQTVVKRVEETMSASDLVQHTVRHMSPAKLLEAVKSTWDLDKQSLARWRGEILEGALAGTRYKFFEWVGKNNYGFFRGLDFYNGGIGIQVKTLHALPKVNEYKGFLNGLRAMRNAGLTPDNRRLTGVALDIWIPEGFKGPKGKEAEFARAIADIKAHGKQLGIPVNVFETSLKNIQLMEVVKVGK